MYRDIVLSGSIVAVAYLALIATIALVAATHPDEKRRKDAREVLDRLLRARRR